MKVLVDSSVWIEYFRSHPQMARESLDFLDLLLADDRACIIWPVQAELLSGKSSSEKIKEIRDAFDAVEHIDLDWNMAPAWERVIELADIARKKSLPLPGLVDRMILSAAEKADVSLWTLDGSMKRVAGEIGVRLF